MAARFTLVVCLTVAIAALAAQAGPLDSIKLDDATANAIGQVDVSNALGGVIGAYKNQFKFDSTHALRKFLSQCEQLDAAMADVKDKNFGPLAIVNTVVTEPSVKQACSVTPAQLTADFDGLDDLSLGDNIYPPLSNGVFSLFVALTGKVNADPVLSQVAGHLVKSKVEEVGAQLMSGAPNDIEMIIGEKAPAKGFFDFETTYFKFCEISLIAPICKLVRNTPLQVPAIAADIKKFTGALKSGAAEVAEHTGNSGVSLEELKANCDKLQKNLRPIRQIYRYLEAGLINEETLEGTKATDPSLDSYVALYDLCQAATL